MPRYTLYFLLFCTLFLFSQCEEDSSQPAELYSAIPQNVAAVVEFHDLTEEWPEFSQTALYRELDSLPFVMHLKKELDLLQNLAGKDSLDLFMKDRPLIMASALSGADKFDLIFLTTGDQKFEARLARQLKAKFKLNEKNYSGTQVIELSDESRRYFMCSYQGILMFSDNYNLVQESIRQINSEFSLNQLAEFKRLQKTANTKDAANLYINPAELKPLVQKWLPNAQSAFVDRLGGWLEMDLEYGTDELILSGLSLLPEEEALYLQCFQGLEAQEAQADQVIPAGAGLWISGTFGNAERYYRQYKDYLKKASRLRKHQQLLEKISPKAEQRLLQWVDNEIGLVSLPSRQGTHYLAYLAYRDEDLAREQLDSLASADFIEGYRGLVIKKLAAENALPRFYGPIFSNFHHPYYILHDGFAIFCETLPSLKGVVNDLLDGKTLSKSEAFGNFRSQIPSEVHLQAIALNPAGLSLMEPVMGSEAASTLEQNRNRLENLRWAAMQFEVEEKAALCNFYLKHATRRKELVSRNWSTQLQTEAANTPQFLKNHSNGHYDVAVQDEDNRLYLISAEGKIRWTKMLDGPIMGDITQVDAYKNRKLQMVFNTRDQLYLVDRLGRDVESFPVKLAEAATAPVGVFNYDNARNYRLVIPSGQDLLNYDIEGKQVAGWDFKPAGSEIITKPQHFSVSGKDIIVVETAEGKLLQLNRRGEQRFEIINGLPRLDIPFYLKSAETLAESEMLSTGDDGKLYAFHPGGTADKLFLEEDHPAEHFLYFDDKYIFSSDEMLFVKSDEQPWSAELEGDISSKPKAMIYKDNFYVGAYSEDAEKISLYNHKGELVAGFPVFGQGPFDMGSLKADGNINIVTYSEDGTLICYRVE